MKGSVYRRCGCRDPGTRRPLGQQCPDLKKRGHGGWYFRYDAPALAGQTRRRPEFGPFETKKRAEEELAAELARVGGGAPVTDRSLLVRDYLDTWLAGKKLRLKPDAYTSYAEACELYFKPGVGHLRLVELRDRHLQDLVTAMTQINQPLPDSEKPSEMLRRLVAVRADDTRKMLPNGEARHKKSTKPLSSARIEREFAVIRAALNDAIPSKILISPFNGVVLPRVDKAKSLVWTPAREARFRAELGKRLAGAEAAADDEDRVLTIVERQALWAARDLRPVPSMVWMPAHAGEFADYLDRTGERLAVLFIVAMYTGMRRDELLGLTWSEIDLDEGAASVLETASGDGPKSEAGDRVVPLSPTAVTALRAWRKVQVTDRLAWGPDWPGKDRVFTREDGTEVPGQWTSTRFEILAFRAGVPPVRFHDLRHGTASLLKRRGVALNAAFRRRRGGAVAGAAALPGRLQGAADRARDTPWIRGSWLLVALDDRMWRPDRLRRLAG
ncbi:site-specific integrase [Trebonia sp.]|uniref:site-specific integrase n=1 Tax=Trebonia sp. TaxID=2767075 RepID=UPI00261DF5AA|nr:site-specific integrase [Trebonia sp.]